MGRRRMHLTFQGQLADESVIWTMSQEFGLVFNIRQADLEEGIGIHLYGRRLYEIMASYWPTAAERPSAPKVEIEYARIWKGMKKIVFSKTLDQVGWNAQLVKENIAEVVNSLKAQPGQDMSVGGAEIASTFTQLGLIDEYRLYVHPIVLGGGKPMFRESPDRMRMKLIETHTFGSGVVLLRYRPLHETE